MKHGYSSLAALLLAATAARAQNVGIGTTTPNASAVLDLSATGKGLLIPRMDSVTRARIGTPPDGLMVFQTNGRKGFWYAVASGSTSPTRPAAATTWATTPPPKT